MDSRIMEFVHKENKIVVKKNNVKGGYLAKQLIIDIINSVEVVQQKTFATSLYTDVGYDVRFVGSNKEYSEWELV